MGKVRLGKRLWANGEAFDVVDLVAGPGVPRVCVLRYADTAKRTSSADGKPLTFTVPRDLVEELLRHQPFVAPSCSVHVGREVALGPPAVLCEECAYDAGVLRKAVFYGLTFDLLVDKAGASEEDRWSFMHAFMKDDRDPVEYRFQGLLGFGGKFWRSDGRHYVNYYQEDVTGEREKLVEVVNGVVGESEKILGGKRAG